MGISKKKVKRNYGLFYAKYKNNENSRNIKLFSDEFIFNNNNNFGIIYNNKLYPCQGINNFGKSEIINIKIILFERYIIGKQMFEGCSSLLSISELHEKRFINFNNDMSYMFYGCESLEEISISFKLNKNNFVNTSYMFYGCKSLKILPDISKYNYCKVLNISSMFANCCSLENILDILNFNIEKVNDLSFMFFRCNNLKSLPDISKWSTNNVENMSYMFSGCYSLYKLPDISKWNVKNVPYYQNIILILLIIDIKYLKKYFNLSNIILKNNEKIIIN